MKMKSVLTMICAILFAGCATTNPDVIAKAERVQVLCTIAADVGCRAALLQNPEYRLPIQLAYTRLNQLIADGKITGQLLRDIIASLPVKELKSQEAIIAVEAATTLYDMTLSGKINIESAPYVKAAAIGLRDGLARALGGP